MSKWLPAYPATIRAYRQERQKVVESRAAGADTEVEEVWGDIKVHVFFSLLAYGMHPENADHQRLHDVLDRSIEEVLDSIDQYLDSEALEVEGREAVIKLLFERIEEFPQLYAAIAGPLLSEAINMLDLALPPKSN